MHDSAIDVHQHLWPDELVDELRARTRPPFLRDWTLHTDGEPPYVVDPSAHDPEARVAVDRAAGVGVACVSLSAPLGIESLPRRDAAPLIRAWHRGAAALPQHFRAWASVPAVDPDLEGLLGLLGDPRFVGLALPATQLLTPPTGNGSGRSSPWPRPPTYPSSSTRPRSRARRSTATSPAGGRRWSATPRTHRGLVGVARRLRPHPVPAAAAGLRGRRGARSGAPRAARDPRRYAGPRQPRRRPTRGCSLTAVPDRPAACWRSGAHPQAILERMTTTPARRHRPPVRFGRPRANDRGVRGARPGLPRSYGMGRVIAEEVPR